jgi:hypothetical protein
VGSFARGPSDKNLTRERKREDAMNEQKPKRENEIFHPSGFCQVGIVVKSIDETIKYYEKMALHHNLWVNGTKCSGSRNNVKGKQ